MTNQASSNKTKNDSWFKSNYQTDFDSHLGSILKETREKLGYSRKQFVHELDNFYNNEQFISEEHYARIERGERSISAYKLLLLINFFNHSININNKKNTTQIEEITLERLYTISSLKLINKQ